MAQPAQQHAQPGRKRLTLLLAVLAAMAVPALPLGLVLLASPQEPGPGEVTSPTAAPALPTPTGAAPAPKVDAVHAALHAIGAACRSDSGPRAASRVRAAVERILEFSSEYPNASLRIDDESGTTLSLLLVTKQSVVDCQPGLVSRIDRAIPAPLR